MQIRKVISVLNVNFNLGNIYPVDSPITQFVSTSDNRDTIREPRLRFPARRESLASSISLIYG